MIKLDFERNLLTTILLLALVMLALIALVVLVSSLRTGVDRIAASGDGRVDAVYVAAVDAELEEFQRYAAIVERPLFFPDRRLPVLEVAVVDAEAPPPPPEPEPVEPLKAAIAGVVITPEVRLAMVADEEAGKTVILREGMALEGVQAAWRLTDITPRGVAFASEDGRSSTLELKVHTASLEAGSSGLVSRAQAEESTEHMTDERTEADAEAARSRAEEIRQRVAERRAELRAEAERRARAQEEGEP